VLPAKLVHSPPEREVGMLMIGTCDGWMFSRSVGLPRESVASSSAVETLFANVYGAISHLSQRSARVTNKGD
jgi:hypothetical protein